MSTPATSLAHLSTSELSEAIEVLCDRASQWYDMGRDTTTLDQQVERYIAELEDRS